MFIKKGTAQISNKNTKNPGLILTGPNGKRYEVSYIAGHIWERLDGKTSLDDVVKEIQLKAKTTSPQLRSVAKEIVMDLRKVGLVSETQIDLTQN